MQKDIVVISHGCKLNGALYMPDIKKKIKNKTLVIVPGGNGRFWKRPDGIDFIGYDKLAEELSESEFVVLTYNGRGQGDSEGIRTMKSLAEDLDSVIENIFEDKLPGSDLIDKSRVGILGVCIGGSVVCKQMISEKRVKSIAVYGAVLSWKRCVFKNDEFFERWKKRKEQVGTRVDFETEKRLIEECSYDLEFTLPQLSQHILIANGTEDRDDRYEYNFNEFVDETVMLIRKIEKAKSAIFSMIKGGGHVVNYGDTAFNSFLNLMKGWFLTTL
jgi:dipeptidyl aminopeptidase/acylaminoacyl peptidase